MNSTTEICEDKERVKLRKEMLVQKKLEKSKFTKKRKLRDQFGGLNKLLPINMG